VDEGRDGGVRRKGAREGGRKRGQRRERGTRVTVEGVKEGCRGKRG